MSGETPKKPQRIITPEDIARAGEMGDEEFEATFGFSRPVPIRIKEGDGWSYSYIDEEEYRRWQEKRRVLNERAKQRKEAEARARAEAEAKEKGSSDSSDS